MQPLMVLLLLTLLPYFVVSSNATSSQLLLVQVVWRHGDRTPVRTFKNDKYNETDWKEKMGGLTLLGMERQFKLGKLLRNEYIDSGFLSSRYSSDEVYISSTDHDRTILSGTSNLLGMFSTDWAEQGSDYPNIAGWPAGFVPIPVHTVEKRHDYLIDLWGIKCDRYDWLWAQVKETVEYQQLRDKNQDFLDKVSQFAGQEVNLCDIWELYDVISLQFRYGKQPDVGVETFLKMEKLKLTIDDMQDGLRVAAQNGINFRKEIPKLRGGPLLMRMVKTICLKLACVEEPNHPDCRTIRSLKYYAYSAHDNTITGLLSALGDKIKVIPFGYPYFSSCLAVELWRLADGSAGVKLRYHDEDDILPDIRSRLSSAPGFKDVTKIIAGCENLPEGAACPLHIVSARAKAYDPGDMEKLCSDVTSLSTDEPVASELPRSSSPTLTEIKSRTRDSDLQGFDSL